MKFVFLILSCLHVTDAKPSWPYEFLKSRKRRANSWHHSEEIFEGSFEQECIEETCDFGELYEIDDDLKLARDKWDYYQKCHDRY